MTLARSLSLRGSVWAILAGRAASFSETHGGSGAFRTRHSF
jgi:hypothetical protein